MKWLGVTSWGAYQDLPADIVDEAIGLMHYEYEEDRRRERHYRQHRGSKSSRPPPYIPEEYVSPTIAPVVEDKDELPVELDERTGREFVVREKPDGTIVKHRQVSEADMLMWTLTGKIPKSWQGKVDPPMTQSKKDTG
jgi:hypothetical protein